ncbi:MAG TPA: hypothetical protein VK638_36370 [Edaphobacter sp.]|nr:hypothetical protein [Edaphobacter sp.]
MSHDYDLALSRKSLLPWRRAESLRDVVVLWMPCRFGDVPYSQQVWLSLFLNRWFVLLASEYGLEEEYFVQMETLEKEKKLYNEFNANLLKERPLIGRSISSLQTAPKGAPTDEEIDLLIKGEATYDFYGMSASRVCWFRGDTAALRTTYFGFGGMTMLLIPPSGENQEEFKDMQNMISRLKLPAFLRKDTRMVALVEGLDPQKPFDPPPFIRNHPAMAHWNTVMGSRKQNPQKLLQRVAFGQKTKEVFGRLLKGNLEYDGIPFLLPRLSSAEIFHSTVEERASWFQLFDVYLRESPEDDGMLLAAKPELLSGIVQVVASLRDDGYRYWEG